MPKQGHAVSSGVLPPPLCAGQLAGHYADVLVESNRGHTDVQVPLVREAWRMGREDRGKGEA